MTTQSVADWEAIRAAYTKRDVSVSEIAKQYRVTAGSIWTRARREDWPKPVSGVDRRSHGPGSGPATKNRRADNSKPRNRTQVKRHLLDVLAMQLERLERRILSETEMTSSDTEREARALNSLVRNFEALDAASQADGARQTGASAGKAGAGKRGNVAKEAAADDKDTLRNELAERLKRLQAQLTERD